MTDSPGTLFDSLLAVMARLRAEEGCPWDREQTRASLKPYLIEEAYEALEALESGKRDAMMEELGDLLFQVVFHAQVARELGEFTMADLLERLVAKMVRRHPHVFGEAKVSTAREAFSQWERIKHEEATRGGASRSVLDGVPQSLPALLRAQRLQEKAARTGFDWKDAAGAWAKVKEEVREVDEARQREMWQWAGVAGFLVIVLLFSAWQHFELLRHGYQIEQLARQRADGDETARQLRLTREAGRSLFRVVTFTHTDVLACQEGSAGSLPVRRRAESGNIKPTWREATSLRSANE